MTTEKSQDGEHTFKKSGCAWCIHRVEVGEQFSHHGWTCKAFPDGIPYMVFSGYLLHDTPFDGGFQEGSFAFESKTFQRSSGEKIRYSIKGDSYVVDNK